MKHNILSPILGLALFLLGVVGCQGAAPTERPSQEPGQAALPASPAWPERLRGCNVTAGNLDATMIAQLAAQGVNHLRACVNADPGADPLHPSADPLADYAQALRALDAVLPDCRRLGVHLVVGAGDIPGRKLDVFWKQERSVGNTRAILAAFWRAFAARYHGEAAIIGYDIFNEPNYPDGRAEAWYGEMLPDSLAAIRAVNPDITVIVEPGPWGLPWGFENLPVIADPHVVYSFHHYGPHDYTHQGVGAKRKTTRGTLSYPGPLRMFGDWELKQWDQAAIDDSFAQAIAFQRRTGCRIYVGEFGVARWAPGRERWLADSIALFEQHGWDWVWHSPSGWNGWNHTFAPEAAEANVTGATMDGGASGPAMQAVRDGFARNRKP